MGRVVVLAPLPAEALQPQLPGHDLVAVGRDEDPVELAAGADVVITDWTAHHRVDAALAEVLAPTCRLVQVPAAGLDGVDVEACRAAGIPVASCAGLNDTAVAEWCVWAAISALRRLVTSDRALRAGRWEQIGTPRYELTGKVVGIVGMGAVGRATAERFGAFGVDLRYWTRHRRDRGFERELGLSYEDLDDLVAAADVLVLALALTEDTRGLLHAPRIASLKPTAVVVNAARGAVTDEEALAVAVREGRIHGVATDVFTTEPVPPDHPLLAEEHAVLTPHVAGASAESVGRILTRALDNVRHALADEPVEGLVT